jgi:hypothetical protein
VECTAFIFSVKEAKQETNKIACHQLHLIFCVAEDGGAMFLRNFGGFLPDYMVSHLLIVTNVRTSDPTISLLFTVYFVLCPACF